jgi:hypothetical protein
MEIGSRSRVVQRRATERKRPSDARPAARSTSLRALRALARRRAGLRRRAVTVILRSRGRGSLRRSAHAFPAQLMHVSIQRAQSALHLFVIAIGCALGACASSSASATKDGGHPIRIQYVHYTSGSKLELIDRSLSSSADLYSKTRKLEDASTKVTTDEILQETLSLFESKGFFDKAEPGGSPAAGKGLLYQSLEVETPERFVHMTVQKGSTPADVKVFNECWQAFRAIYNDTYQLQAVDHPPDWNAQNKSPSPSPKKLD